MGDRRPINKFSRDEPASTRGSMALSLVGFVSATMLLLLTLRRHRKAISGYLAAETRAVQRSRELEFATVESLHRQKMKALGTLAAGIAHDFDNLLSVIRMSNQLIGREVPQNAEVREHVETVEQEGFGLAVESLPGQDAVFHLGISLTKDSAPARHSHSVQPATLG